jgi:hypothetical protein
MLVRRFDDRSCCVAVQYIEAAVSIVKVRSNSRPIRGRGHIQAQVLGRPAVDMHRRSDPNGPT